MKNSHGTSLGSKNPEDNTSKIKKSKIEEVTKVNDSYQSTQICSPTQTLGSPVMESSKDKRVSGNNIFSSHMFLNEDFQNLPEIPKLNQQAEKLNHDNFQLSIGSKSDSLTCEESCPYNSISEQQGLRNTEKKKQVDTREKEVPLYKDFKLPEVKRATKGISSSLDFRTPMPKPPRKFSLNMPKRNGKQFGRQGNQQLKP